jgi:hypothetical protein
MSIVATDPHRSGGIGGALNALPSRRQLTGSAIRISDTDDLDVVGSWIEFLADGTVTLVAADDIDATGVARTVAAKDWLWLAVRRIKATGTTLTVSQIVVHYPDGRTA